MPRKKLLACGTGQIEEASRQQVESVLEENRVCRALIDRHSPRWRLQDAERKVLAEKGKLLGKLLGEVITIMRPKTLLKWHRRLGASKWDFSRRRKSKLGRPSVPLEIERVALQFVRENPGWGYDRIVGTLANLGHRISDQTIGHILNITARVRHQSANATPLGPHSYAHCKRPRNPSLPPPGARLDAIAVVLYDHDSSLKNPLRDWSISFCSFA